MIHDKKTQVLYSPHGWEKQDLRKLNDVTKVKAQKFETNEKLIQICENPARSFNCKTTLALNTAKKNQEATQIKMKLKNYNPLKREPLFSVQIVLHFQP